MIESVALPGGGHRISDVAFEGAEDLLDALIVRNEHNPMEMVWHR
jgi:hypothetical protein